MTPIIPQWSNSATASSFVTIPSSEAREHALKTLEWIKKEREEYIKYDMRVTLEIHNKPKPFLLRKLFSQKLYTEEDYRKDYANQISEINAFYMGKTERLAFNVLYICNKVDKISLSLEDAARLIHN